MQGASTAITDNSSMKQCSENKLTDAPAKFMVNKHQDISSFRSVFRLNQPAHLVVLLFFAYFWSIFSYESQTSSSPSAIRNFLYLASFAFHFGAQMWMTFISGIVLFFTIPRHTFGMVQEQLFPKYFLLNTALSFITVNTFLQKSNKWTEQTQVAVLCLNFFIELITWLYFVPPILSIIKGVGREESSRARQCPLHGPLQKCFRRLHNLAAIANMAAIACNGYHLYHLADKLS